MSEAYGKKDWQGPVAELPEEYKDYSLEHHTCENFDRHAALGHGRFDYNWVEYPDGPHECPLCVPGQPKPLGERLKDPTDFLGPAWVWCEGRGPMGCWKHRSELFVAGVEHLAELRELGELLQSTESWTAYAAMTVLSAAKLELARLQALRGRSVNQVIDFLNGLLALDADAVTTWVETRVGCNEALAAHPTLQVAGNPSRFGLLGVLNGIFGCDEEGWGFIAAEKDEGRIVRFLRTPERHRLQTEEQRTP